MYASPNLHRLPQLSRRQALLTAGGALIGAPALARVARGDERASSQIGAGGTALADSIMQGAGVYRRSVGDILVCLISDGTFPMTPPFPTFGANAGEEQVRAALEHAFIRPEATLGHVNTLLIRSGDDVVLVDTGCGALFGPSTGKLVAHLANAGVQPRDVTVVVLTHLHPDHIGGLLGPTGVELFPSAQYLVHEAERAFWAGGNPDFSKSGVPEAMRASMAQGAAGLLKAMEPRLKLIGDQNLRIAEGVQAVAAPGHTPGHIGLHVTGGRADQLLYIADAVHHHAIVMPNPDWYVAFDTDRDAAVAARRALLDMAASEKLLVSGAHLPFPGFGHVRKNGSGYDWVPVVWEW